MITNERFTASTHFILKLASSGRLISTCASSRLHNQLRMKFCCHALPKTLCLRTLQSAVYYTAVTGGLTQNSQTEPHPLCLRRICLPNPENKVVRSEMMWKHTSLLGTAPSLLYPVSICALVYRSVSLSSGSFLPCSTAKQSFN